MSKDEKQDKKCATEAHTTHSHTPGMPSFKSLFRSPQSTREGNSGWQTASDESFTQVWSIACASCTRTGHES